MVSAAAGEGTVLPLDAREDVRPPHLMRHRDYPMASFPFGIGPYDITTVNPTFRECADHFGTYEYGLIAATTGLPAGIGYYAQRSLRSFPFLFGLTAGAIAGVSYAYAYSFSKLSGFLPYKAPPSKDKRMGGGSGQEA